MNRISKFVFYLFIFLCIQSILTINVNASQFGSQYRITAVKPSSIKITNAPNKLTIGSIYVLETTILPSNAVDKTVNWTSSDEKVAVIDKNGKIVAKSEGTTYITAKTTNGKTDSVAIKVRKSDTFSVDLKNNIDVMSIKIDGNKDVLFVGDTLSLKASFNPSNASDKEITWRSSDENIATVDSDGKVIAKNAGLVTITVNSSNGKTSEVKINVLDVKLSETNITVIKNKKQEVVATVKIPKQLSDSIIDEDSFSWSTGNASILNITYDKKIYNNLSSGENGIDIITYKATVFGKNVGNSTLAFKILGRDTKIKAKVVGNGADYSIQCPEISYDTSNANEIDLTVNSNNPDIKYDVYISHNGAIGQFARWRDPIYIEQSGVKTFKFKYEDSQVKLVLYSNSGTSRACYSAPFEYDKIQDNSSIKCPVFSPKVTYMPNQNEQTSLYIKVPDDNYGDKKHTGVKSVEFKVDKDEQNGIYQYSWYDNNDYKIADRSKYGKDKDGKTIVDEKFFWHPKLKGTFDSEKTFTLDTTTGVRKHDDDDLLAIHSRQGIYLAIDKNGNVRKCSTDGYTGYSFEQKSDIGGTKVYIQTGVACEHGEMTYNYLKDIKAKAPYLYNSNGKKLGEIYISQNGFGCWARGNSTIQLPCKNYDTYIAPIHELAHAWDAMNGITDNDMYNSKEFKSLRTKYKEGAATDILEDGNRYSWYYAQWYEPAQKEFFVGLYVHYYLNKYYGNYSDSEIDSLPIHSQWKWILKNHKYPNDVKSYIENTVSKYGK